MLGLQYTMRSVAETALMGKRVRFNDQQSYQPLHQIFGFYCLQTIKNGNPVILGPATADQLPAQLLQQKFKSGSLMSPHTCIHNWPLQPFSQDYRPSFSLLFLLYALIFMHKRREIKFKVDSERKILEKFFMAVFIYSQIFCQKFNEKKSPKKYFLYFVLMSGLWFEPWLYV